MEKKRPSGTQREGGVDSDLLPARFRLPLSPPPAGRGRVHLGVGRAGKGAEDGDGVGLESRREAGAWQSPG